MHERSPIGRDVTFFSRNWFDRFFRREREIGAGAEAVRTEARAQEQSPDVRTNGAGIEEGASAARDDVVRREPMPPPGTG